jgi:hypothetical protein
LEEILNDRNRQLHIANEQRCDYDRIANKLNEWIRNAEQHVKDPLTNDFQQPVNGLREKSKTLQVRNMLLYHHETGEGQIVHFRIKSFLEYNYRITEDRFVGIGISFATLESLYFFEYMYMILTRQ